SGRVGTKQVHDAAIQTAIALGIAVRDDLIIDTAEAHRAAAVRAAGLAPGATTGTPAYYVYPQPLMGRFDEPFFGFEPPLVSYPPWWGAVAPREQPSVAVTQPQPAAAPASGSQQSSGSAPANTQAPAVSAPAALPPTIEMAIDPQGVAVLTGTVPTLTD